MDIEKLKFPIGKFQRPEKVDASLRNEFIQNIEELPIKMAEAVSGLSSDQLDTPYRPGGWTVRQVVHHVADSHMNSYIRFKWAMTEDQPMIKAYDEKSWAEQEDAKNGPIDMSLSLLESLHRRFTYYLKSMSDQDFKRQLGHPEWNHRLSLDIMCALYSWHSLHHTAHVTELRKRKGW